MKIVLREKVNLKPVLEKYLRDRTKVSVSTPNISKREIIELIYDNFPQLREWSYMDKENIKLLIKQEYENGTSMSVLAKKYDTNISNIKKWSFQEKWIKKKQNKVTKKGIAKTKKSNQTYSRNKTSRNTKENCKLCTWPNQKC